MTYMFPRFDALQAASGGGDLPFVAISGSHPVYEIPDKVVIFVMRPWAKTCGIV